jgi:hypothetical protein
VIAPAFAHGLHLAFDFAAGTSLVGAIASWLRGGRYIHAEDFLPDNASRGLLEVGDLASAEVGAGVVNEI